MIATLESEVSRLSKTEKENHQLKIEKKALEKQLIAQDELKNLRHLDELSQLDKKYKDIIRNLQFEVLQIFFSHDFKLILF